jgi:hypothetical protein
MLVIVLRCRMNLLKVRGEPATGPRPGWSAHAQGGVHLGERRIAREQEERERATTQQRRDLFGQRGRAFVVAGAELDERSHRSRAQLALGSGLLGEELLGLREAASAALSSSSWRRWESTAPWSAQPSACTSPREADAIQPSMYASASSRRFWNSAIQCSEPTAISQCRAKPTRSEISFCLVKPSIASLQRPSPSR